MERYLVLEDGKIFKGKAFGAIKASQGQLRVFVGAQGYQEAMTNPMNTNTLLIFAYPEIGNTGINRYDEESLAITCSGIIVKEAVAKPSNWRSHMALETYMLQHDIPGIYGIDTRELVQYVRDHEVMHAKLVDAIDTVVSNVVDMDEVSCKSSYRIQGKGASITVLDLGITQSTLEYLRNKNFDIQVVPYDTSAQAIIDTQPSTVLISNGPVCRSGLETVKDTIKQLKGKTAIIGVGLGAHLLSDQIPNQPKFITQHVTKLHNQVVGSMYGGLSDISAAMEVYEYDLNTHKILGYQDTQHHVYAIDMVENDPRFETHIDRFMNTIEISKEIKHV